MYLALITSSSEPNDDGEAPAFLFQLSSTVQHL